MGTKLKKRNILCQYLLIPKVGRNCHSFSSIAKPTLPMFPKNKITQTGKRTRTSPDFRASVELYNNEEKRTLLSGNSGWAESLCQICIALWGTLELWGVRPIKLNGRKSSVWVGACFQTKKHGSNFAGFKILKCAVCGIGEYSGRDDIFQALTALHFGNDVRNWPAEMRMLAPKGEVYG